jgi:sterol-4alpha-carboxylate 3-dehydrogenase (decarboxylating)
MENESHAKWGPILIVGGSGRLGYFIALQLLQQPECGRVVSVSRSNKIAHPCDGVEYRVADVRDSDALGNVMREVMPETIINSAAPAHVNTVTPSSEFEQVFVKGQDTLMALAQQVGTKYIICTTSSSVIEGYNHVQADETVPLWPENSAAFPYWVQRARAEKRLLAVDSATFQTVSLRLPLIIGEREYAFVPAMLKTMKEGNTGVQIGSDHGLLATVSGNDAARAHILALRALMKPRNDVHGEAFYITGKTALSFWTMARIIWNEAGWEQEKAPFVMPEWVAKLMAVGSETIMRPFGIEPQLTMHMLRFMCNTWTYDGSKARDRLRYVPEDDTEDQLRKSVRWHLKHEAA